MTSTNPNPPRTLSTGASLLLALACLLYIAMMFFTLGSEPVIDCGDPASCGITKGLGDVSEVLGRSCTLLLWIVLALLLFAGGITGQMKIVAATLFPLSGVAAIVAGALYSRYGAWSITVPALLAPLIALYAVWARLPALHAALPAKIVNVAAWGAILILTIAPFPLSYIDAGRFAAAKIQRQAELEASAAHRQEEEAQSDQRVIARFQALNPDSSLGEYLEATSDYNYYLIGHGGVEAHLEEELAKGRQIKSRQADAAMLLQEGKIEWLEQLWNLDVEATPAICKAYDAALRQEAPKIEMRTTTVGAHCDLDAALGLVETRFREWCDGPHQCAASDIADRPILNFLDTLAALRQPH